MGAAVLVISLLILASATSVELTALGAAIWGLQLAITQGLLVASIADAAPDELRGTAFGIFEFAVGFAAFLASAVAGILWVIGGPPCLHSPQAPRLAISSSDVFFFDLSQSERTPVSRQARYSRMRAKPG
jgi:hypothetical protein